MEQFTKYDFVRRTQAILMQYESFKLPEEENYDVTLLINACVGLLFIAHETGIKPIGTPQSFGIHASDLSKCHRCRGENELQALMRHTRNAIAHNRFGSIGKDRIITRLHFYDCYKNGKRNFQLDISVADFKNFVMNISNDMLSHE